MPGTNRHAPRASALLALDGLARLVGDPAGQDPSLARPSTRDDEEGSAPMLDGGTLRLVEVPYEPVLTIGGDGHTTIVGAGTHTADSLTFSR